MRIVKMSVGEETLEQNNISFVPSYPSFVT